MLEANSAKRGVRGHKKEGRSMLRPYKKYKKIEDIRLFELFGHNRELQLGLRE